MNCICNEANHDSFNNIIKNELKFFIDVNEIVNKNHCTSIDLDLDRNLIDVTLNKNEILSSFNKMVGIYHLWVKEDYCLDHTSDKYLMLCVYVGKGHVKKRIKSHIKNKWAKKEKLYISFYECDNRISKYLEQLFLDIYKFHLNSQENTGSEYLKTVWDEERFIHGTDFSEQMEMMEKKNPDMFNLRV